MNHRLSQFYSIRALAFLALLIAALCNGSTPLLAQSPSYVQYTVNNGLASNVVYQVYQDRQGFIWFATEAGVNRFDGFSFQTYTHNSGLADSEVFFIQEDSKDRMWFLSFNGELSYMQDGVIYNQKNDSTLAGYEPRGFLNGMFEDSKGRIWFWGETYNPLLLHPDGKIEWVSLFEDNRVMLVHEFEGQLYFYDSNQRCYVFDLEETRFSLETGTLKTAFSNHTHPNSWGYHPKEQAPMHIRNNEFFLSPQHQKFEKRGHLAFEGENTQVVKVGYDARSNRVWVATTIGLYFLEEEGQEFTLSQIFHDAIATSALIDEEENLWITTHGSGVFLSVAPDIWSYSAPEMAEDPSVYRMMTDDEGELWWAGKNGWFGTFDRGTYEVKQAFEGQPQVRAREIEVVGNEVDMAFSLEAGIALSVNGQEQFLSFPLANKNLDWHPKYGLAIATKVWVAILSEEELISLAKPFGHFTKNQFNVNGLGQSTPSELGIIKDFGFFKSPDRIYEIQFIGDELWMATDKNLVIYNMEDKSFSTKPINLGGRIIQIKQGQPDKDGNSIIWLVSETDGILGLRKEGEEISISGMLLGQGAAVQSFYPENDSSLWVGTRRGVFHIRVVDDNFSQFQMRRYAAQDGLPSNFINDLKVIGDTLYVADALGITLVSKSTLRQEIIPPKVFITEAENSRDGTPLSEYEMPLASGINNLNIRFVGLHFRSRGAIEYRYRLHEDYPWTNTLSREVSLFDLEPGKYTFEVQARVENSAWSPISASQSFTIQSPFWRRPWFWSGVLTLVMGIVWLGLWLRMRRVRERKELTFLAATAELKALRAQISPHFIFNALSSIQRFVLNNNKEAANTYLTKFSRLIRMILHHSDQSEVYLQDELQAIQHYLDIERMRLSERFDYVIDCPDESLLQQVMLPPMILHTFVENAIWHGIMGLEGDGQIRISVEKEAETGAVRVTVRDNGVGRKVAQQNRVKLHRSKGLGLVEEKLAVYNQMNNRQVTYTIEDLYTEDQKPAGTQVTVIFP